MDAISVIGTNTSIELGSDGSPIIAYNNYDKQLSLARREDGEWHIEVVDEDGPFVIYVSLELDDLDRPYITYYYFNYPEYYIKLARWTGTEWNIEIVETNSNNCDMALDSAGRPHIACNFYDGEVARLRYTYWNGEEWRHEDTGGNKPLFTSIALDSADRPHISYMDGDDRKLRYAHWDDSGWHIELVDPDDAKGYYTSIAVDSLDRPHIVYEYDYPHGHLKYAFLEADKANWRIETIDTESSGGRLSLALDSADRPCISYFNFLYDTTRYARWDGDAWNIYSIDPSSCSGDYTSLALDSSDLPHISLIGACDNSRFYGLVYAWYEVFFHLLSPGRGEVVSTLTPTLDWSDDDNPDLVSYTLWWGEDPDFENYNEVADIGESKYQITEGIEDGDRIYWRVKSIDDGGEERWAEEMDWNFTVYLNFNPDFHLLEPERGEVVDTTTPTLDWEDQKIPNLESYTLWWGEAPDFETYNEVVGIGESEYRITEGIEDGDRVWWRVKSIDEEGEEYWAEELDWYFDVDLSGGVEIVDLGADAADGGVLVKWEITGDTPAGLRVLRSVGEGEPVAIHENQLPGTATSYLDRLDKGLKPLASGIEYRYWLEVTEADGTTSRFGPTEAVTVPEETFNLVLYAAYPSPSREVINFVYSLPAEGRVTLSVYDLSGRRVATLIDTEQTVGRHEASWNCGEVPPGVYLYSLQTAAGSLTQRLVIGR